MKKSKKESQSTKTKVSEEEAKLLQGAYKRRLSTYPETGKLNNQMALFVTDSLMN